MIWVPWPAWFRTCLPAKFCSLCFLACLPISPLVSRYTLDAQCFGPPLSPGCLPLLPFCLPLHSGCCECFGPHDFTLVSQLHLSPSALWMHWALWSTWFQGCLPVHAGCCCPHDFTLVSHSCLPLHFGFSGRDFTLVPSTHRSVYTSLSLLPTPWVVLHCLRYHHHYHHHQPPSTNHRLQPVLAQTGNNMKLDWTTKKLFGIIISDRMSEVMSSRTSSRGCWPFAASTKAPRLELARLGVVRVGWRAWRGDARAFARLSGWYPNVCSFVLCVCVLLWQS